MERSTEAFAFSFVHGSNIQAKARINVNDKFMGKWANIRGR